MVERALFGPVNSVWMAWVASIANLCRRVAFYAAVVSMCVAAVFPYYWMVITSVQRTGNLFVWPPKLFPGQGANFHAYIEIFRHSGLSMWLWNSLRVSFGTSLIALFVAVLSAYSLSRFWFRGKTLSQIALLMTQMFPGVLLVLPMYLLFARLRLLDSLWGLTVAYVSFLIPAAASLLKGFFDTIPVELEEASIMDGATRLGTLFRITLPLSLPGLMSTFLFAFIIAWDEYLFARTFIQTPDNWTISLGLASYIGEYVTPWDQIMSAAAVVTVPISLLFLFLQRYLLRGLTAGAVNG